MRAHRSARWVFAGAFAALTTATVTGCVELSASPRDNVAPVAVVTDSITVSVGERVQLDGSGSYDADGDPLIFQWAQLSPGEPVQLEGSTSAVAGFFAPETGQRLFFQLVVSDGAVESEPVTVRVRVNSPPVAGGPDEVRITGSSSVAVEGTGIDPDGDAIASYRWRVASAPAAAASCTAEVAACLSGADTPTVTFTPPVKGDYVLELIVSDGALDSAPHLVDVSGPNFGPSASVDTPTINAAPGSTVVLSGSATDPDGDSLTYLWEQITGIGQSVILESAETAQASFDAPAIGQTLSFRFVASDGELSSAPIVVLVYVNTPPLANAGPAQVLNGTDTAVLVGAGADPDGEPIVGYEWRVVSAPAAGASCVTTPPTPSPCLLGDTSSIVTFTVPSLSARGEYVLELRVSDGKVFSLPSEVTVRGPNTPPVATAPASLVVATGDTVDLVGGGTDDDGDELTYSWSQLSGDPVQLTGADAATASFAAPDLGQRMYFQLVVSDGLADSESALSYVRVNGPPVADAGSAMDVIPGEAALVQGAGSDPDVGDEIVEYIWTVASGPAGSSCLVTPPTLSPCFGGPGAGGAIVFTAPDKGDYVLELVVSDGILTSQPSSVLIRALNRAPTALATFTPAGPFFAGDTVTLDAVGSTDIDGDAIASWRWVVADKPLGASVTYSPATADAEQTLVTLGLRGSYLFELTVTDADDTNPATDTDTIRVDVANTPPVANAGTGAAVPNGSQVVLFGSGDDADDDTLSWSWVMLEAPNNQTVTLVGENGPTVNFTPTQKTAVTDPAQCGVGQCYKLALTVDDGFDTDTDFVYVTSLDRAPVAIAGDDFSVVDSSLVELDGLASSDPDGDAVTLYRWTQLLGADVTAGVGYLDGPQQSFSVPDPQDTYVFSLSVRAAGVWSAPDEITVFVNNGDQRPSLSSSGTEFSAVEGSPFVGFGIDATDAEVGTLTITWTRQEGSDAFPSQIVQTQVVGGQAPADPAITIASYADMFDGGDNATHAVYSVVARDEANNESDPLLLTLYVLPDPANFYFLSPTGLDTNPCTDTAPCYTLLRASQAARNSLRDVIMLGGSYNWNFDSISLRIFWPSNARLFASREATTYARSSTATHLRLDRAGCAGENGAIILLGVTGVEFHDFEMDVAGESGNCLTPGVRGIECDTCQADFYGVHVNAVQPILTNWGARPTHQTLFATNAANLYFARGTLRVANGTRVNRAVDVRGGAVVTIEESEIFVVAGDVNGDNAGIRVQDGATVSVNRSQVLLYGDDPGAPDFGTGRYSAGVFVTNGSLSMENSVVHVTAGPEALGIYVGAGTMSLVNNTLVAPTSVSGASAGIVSYVGFDAMNNLVKGFLWPLLLADPAALESQLFSNAWTGTGAEVALCDGNAVTSVDALNAAPGTGPCNQSTVTWSGNIVGPCPLVNVAGRDFHLTPSTGACVDAGALTSPAGVAPVDDMDATYANAGDTLLNKVRPSPRSPSVDIGADEAD